MQNDQRPMKIRMKPNVSPQILEQFRQIRKFLKTKQQHSLSSRVSHSQSFKNRYWSNHDKLRQQTYQNCERYFMIECSKKKLWQYVSVWIIERIIYNKYYQDNILKNLSGIKMQNLMLMQLNNNSILNIQCITWLNAQNIRTIQLQGNFITSLRPMAKTAFKNYKQKVTCEFNFNKFNIVELNHLIRMYTQIFQIQGNLEKKLNTIKQIVEAVFYNAQQFYFQKVKQKKSIIYPEYAYKLQIKNR